MILSPLLGGLKVSPEQMLEVLGGIVNLYDDKALGLRVDGFQIVTEHTFASSYVPLDTILAEIGYTSGYKKHACMQIWSAIEATVRSYFNSSDDILNLKFLGTLRPVDLEHSAYSLQYRYTRL